MSAAKTSLNGDVLCDHCGERGAQPGALRWYAAPNLLGLVFGAVPARDRHCDDCAGGLNLLGLIALCVLFLFALVAIVVVL